MKKQTTVEVLLEKCPSCGAPRVGQEATCHYCGCSMIQTKRIIEEVEDAPVASNAKKDDRRVDIISDVEPPESGEASGKIIGIAFLVVWCTAAFGMGFFALSMGAGPIFGIVPFGMGTVGVIGLITMFLKPAAGYKKVMAQGSEYDAIVLGYEVRPFNLSAGSVNSVQNLLRTRVKVLADIDGRETCILMKPPSSMTELSYPVGCRITIVGLGRDFVVKM